MKDRGLINIFILSAVMFLTACSDSNSDLPEEPQTPALPIVEITTDNGEALTCDYITAPEGSKGQGIANANKVGGRMMITHYGEKLYDSGHYSDGISGMTIKIRGNSSAWEPKKPYRIKLQQPADLLFRNDEKIYRDKDWLLIRDWQASPYILIGTMVNELVGLQWTPRFKYVNLVLNGEYLGLYALIESVKQNRRCRLNVSRTGYIVELDPYWWNEDVYFETLMTQEPILKYTFKCPDTDELTQANIDYIRDYINAFDEGLYYKNHFSEYIDTTSFASWLLGQDILGNIDALGTNIFMTKYDNTPDTKLEMGCLWDFDYIMMSTDTWSESHNLSYFVRLLNNGRDRSFANAYKKKWNEVKDTLFDTVIQRLESFVESEEGQAYERAMIQDCKKWGWSPPDLRQLINKAEAWFENRKKWLETAIEGMEQTENRK